MKTSKLIAFLCHAMIVLAISMLVFLILDQYNPMLGFLSSSYSRAVLGVLALLSLTLGIFFVVSGRRSE